MSDKQWTPHPATIAYRVIEYLKTLPRGKFVATSPLAAEMGQPSSALITALYRPVEHGLVLREKRNGFYHWALSDEGWDLDLDAERDAKPDYKPSKWTAPAKPAVKPKTKPAPAPEPDPEPATLSDTITGDTMWGGDAPAADGGVDMDRVHAKRADPPATPEPEPIPEPTPVSVAEPVQDAQDPVPAAEPDVDEPFRFAWSSDGVLTVTKAGQSVSMQQDEFQTLSRFIDVIGRFKP